MECKRFLQQNHRFWPRLDSSSLGRTQPRWRNRADGLMAHGQHDGTGKDTLHGIRNRDGLFSHWEMGMKKAYGKGTHRRIGICKGYPFDFFCGALFFPGPRWMSYFYVYYWRKCHSLLRTRMITRSNLRLRNVGRMARHGGMIVGYIVVRRGSREGPQIFGGCSTRFLMAEAGSA